VIGILVETPGDFVVLILVEIGNRNPDRILAEIKAGFVVMILGEMNRNPDRILAEIKAGFVIMILGEMSTRESDLNLTEITIIK